MNSSTSWKTVILLTALAFAPVVSAETPAEETDKKCVKPKFRDFSPAANAEVAPGAEISFHINRNADPLHIGASAKKIPLTVKVENKQTFYYATAKLPAELTEGYARIHIEAKAAEGDCIGQDGWLLKIGNKAAAKTVATHRAEGAETAKATSAPATPE